MRTPATLVALSLLALGAPVSSYATDAPATCLGQTATVVAANEEQVTGTNGPDVIVVTGYSDVYALNGDDLVCIRESNARVFAGPGDDVVSSQDLAADSNAYVELGAGSDRFLGGEARDTVDAAEPTIVDVDADEIEAGGGDDEMHSGASGYANADVVRTGPGVDQVVMVPPSDEGVLDAGQGGDIATFDLTMPTRTDWHVHIANRTIAQGGLTGIWSGSIASFEFVADDGAAMPDASTLTVTGSSDPDQVNLNGGGLDAFDISITLRGGRDAVYLAGRNGGSSRYALGAGRDSLSVVTLAPSGRWFRAGETVRVDLANRRVDYGPGTAAAEVTGAENVTAISTRVRIVGDHRANAIAVGGCDVRVHAGEGADRAVHLALGFRRCSQTSRIDGGPGPDLLKGGDRSADRLIGGAGRDTADGRGGTDTCRAEVTQHCERS